MVTKQTKWTEYVPTNDYSEELMKAKVRLDYVMKTKNADVYSVFSEYIGWCFVVLLNGTAIVMDSEGVKVGRKKKGRNDYIFPTGTKEAKLIGWKTIIGDDGKESFVVDYTDNAFIGEPNGRILYIYIKGFNPVTE